MSKAERQTHRQAQAKSSNNSGNIAIAAGLLFFLIGTLIFIAIFHSVIMQELTYRLFPPDKNAAVLTAKEKANGRKVIRPVDENFGIVIPKIGANAKVIANVSPFNEKEYQIQLAKGVAQARDTANPGEYGNTFIFAHSAANLNLANQYNAVFYLLNKLEKNDSVYLFYKGKKYLYRVDAVKIVSSNALEYLRQDNTGKELTLMTCWPPGTTLQRLIVTAKLQ